MRIRPNEVHISHPSSYEVIYRTHSELSKAPYYYSAFGVGLSTWGSLANAEHSQRRAALAPFFSRSAILTYESTLRRPAEAICSRLAGAQRSGASVDLERAYRCVSLDASSQIAFGQSFGFLDVEDFAGWFHAGVEDSLRTICAIRHVPVLVPVFNNLPIWAMRLMGEKLSAPMMLKRLAREAAEKALKMGEEKDVGNERMILGEIVKSKNVARYGVVSKKRLEEEALSLIAASADTVGNALTMATFQLLRHPEILKSLKKELREKIPDPNSIPSFAQLEKLPYLVSLVPSLLLRRWQMLTLGTC